jgi:cellulose synthase (UDP-forming)
LSSSSYSDVLVSSRRFSVVMAIALLLAAAAGFSGVMGALQSAWQAPTMAVALSRWAGALALVCVSVGVFVHLVARLVSLWPRNRQTVRTSDNATAQPRSGVTILVPAYREEVPTLFKTLYAAALQTAPATQVFVLLDDESGGDRDHRHQALSGLPEELTRRLNPARRRCEQTARRLASDDLSPELAQDEYAGLCDALSAWMRGEAATWLDGDSSDRFFAQTTFLDPAAELEAAATQTRTAVVGSVALDRLREAVDQLHARFDPALTVFERKRYENLSHVRDKASNLNAWLALQAGCYREVKQDGRRWLEPCASDDALFTVESSSCVMVIDADTVVAPRYLDEATAFLAQPGCEDVALVQAPYRAFPEASGVLERIAGATTDVQYVVHQGMSAVGAAFWVGANALIRREALDSIAIDDGSGRLDARRGLRSRTVIEDTETSLALRQAGWRLHSLGNPLAFSATPSDFGALIVQRARWANGGLLLLGALLRATIVGRRTSLFGEAPMRLHYLVSLSPTALALLVLPVCLADAGAGAVWLPLMAGAYFAAYTDDLRRAGYRARDVLHVYALNLLLVPINLAALISSLQQAVTGKKARFVTTPKDGVRTAVPGDVVVAELAMLGLWILVAIDVGYAGHTVHAALVAAHAGLLAYGVSIFIGWRAAIGDLRADLAANAGATSGEAVMERRGL